MEGDRRRLLNGDEEDEEYDLSPDEDELEALEALDHEDEESDGLDDMADPRITEIGVDEEEAPKVVKETAKGKNKRPANDSEDEEPNLDKIMAKSLKAEGPATTNGTAKLSKAEKKRLKRLKKNDGEAATSTSASGATQAAGESKLEASAINGEKKVQFAKNLEQGPTPSAGTPSKEKDNKKPEVNGAASPPSLRTVQGVIVEDHKLGTGPAAKKGSRVEMRYIGKLENGKQFDANKKGKPFAFKLGAGEVIKGWDIGVTGMTVGGERRITVPAHLAYGSKGMPRIPANSKLIFDLKLLTVS